MRTNMEHTILQARCQGHEHIRHPFRYRGASRAHPTARGRARAPAVCAALRHTGDRPPTAGRRPGQVLWCVTQQDLFAPALAQAGLVPDRVIYAEAGDEKSVLVCFEEDLRHGGLGAVVAEVARLSMAASRRLQLAAEGSGTVGIAIR